MNFKKYAILSIVVFVVTWVTNFIVHGILLKSLYHDTANLWRPEEDMRNYCLTMLGGQLLAAIFFACIFAHGYKKNGIAEGVRYGLLIGGFQAGHNLIMHAVSPYPVALTAAWILAGFAQAIIAGIAAVMVFDKACKC